MPNVQSYWYIFHKRRSVIEGGRIWQLAAAGSLPPPTPRSKCCLLSASFKCKLYPKKTIKCLHLSSSCSSRGLTSLSGVLMLSVRTIHVGRCRLSMRMSCCRSSFSSSIWAFRSEFNISSLSDSWGRTEQMECTKRKKMTYSYEYYFCCGSYMSHLL